MNIYLQILKKYWGFDNFRPLQDDIIKSIANGHDTLGLMPTGGGKSITFQVPALAKKGCCIVITPLIALMKDQVESLIKRKIKAVAIHAGMTSNEIKIALNNCIFGNVKFLYISPERLNSNFFNTKLNEINVNLIAVDEAHCISQWGYDFRPSYLNISKLRDIYPEIPILALTATATLEVVEDIQNKLKFEQKNVFRVSFERKNITYLVRNTEDKLRYLSKIGTKIKGIGIIYVRNRKKAKEIAQFLNQHKIPSDYYHAGLKHETRNLKQNRWKNNNFRIMVATNAFGMGIDKPDVRYVIHYDLPDSLEAYFQEAGRAGRDEKRAFAVLLYNNADKQKLATRISNSFPEINEIKKVYHALGNYLQIPVEGGKNLSYDFRIADFAAVYNFSILRSYSALKVLEREGYIQLTDEINSPSRVLFKVDRDELYKFQVANSKLDSFIKLLLRSFTGLFTNYTNIDEALLARQAGTDRDTIYQYLVNLNKAGIITYIPQKKSPFIIYTEERLDEKNLFISNKNYSLRKEKFIEKQNLVLEYASNESKCRSQILLSYFGEKNSNPCGNCDICNKKNELNISQYEFDKIYSFIKDTLLIKKQTIDYLVDNSKYNAEKTLKVIRWLLDNNKVIKKDELYFWSSK